MKNNMQEAPAEQGSEFTFRQMTAFCLAGRLLAAVQCNHQIAEIILHQTPVPCGTTENGEEDMCFGEVVKKSVPHVLPVGQVSVLRMEQEARTILGGWFARRVLADFNEQLTETEEFIVRCQAIGTFLTENRLSIQVPFTETEGQQLKNRTGQLIQEWIKVTLNDFLADYAALPDLVKHLLTCDGITWAEGKAIIKRARKRAGRGHTARKAAVQA